MNELLPLESELSALLARIAPASRRQLARQLATELRASQGKRIAAQQNPDGTSFEPRKPRLRSKKGGIRRQMFSRLRTARWLKIETSPDHAAVVFADHVQHMAKVHQLGLRDRVNRRQNNLEVQYPARRLLGITEAEDQTIRQRLLDWLSR